MLSSQTKYEFNTTYYVDVPNQIEVEGNNVMLNLCIVKSVRFEQMNDKVRNSLREIKRQLTVALSYLEAYNKHVTDPSLSGFIASHIADLTNYKERVNELIARPNANIVSRKCCIM